MKNLLIILVCLTTYGQTAIAQEDKREFQLGLATFMHQEQDPQYIYGKVREIKYVAYEAEEVDGKITNGERIKLSDVRGNLIWQTWDYQFNKDGKVIKLARKDDDLQTEWMGIVHYEEDKIKNIYWLHKDTLKGCDSFTYLPDNKIEKKFWSIETGESYGHVAYTYNENGHLLQWERYNSEGQKGFGVAFERNQRGHRVSRTLHNREGEALFKLLDYKYNDKDLPVTWHAVLNRGEEVDLRPTRQYEYDQHGNWVKMIHFGDGEERQIRVVERTITYYE